MSLLEIIAALPSATQIRPFAAPLLIAAILAVHSLYFWVNRASNGQQAISLVDYSQMLGQRIGTGADRMVWVCSDGQELDTVHRRSTPTVLPAKPRRGTRSPGHTRCASRHLVEDRAVATTLVCAEDLECAGESLFLNAVKVGGDLIVRGNARFAAPVIVNGVLKIEGRAHFAEGVLAKGDTFVRGAILIGSNEEQGWAALHDLTIGGPLSLNGGLVATSAVQLNPASIAKAA